MILLSALLGVAPRYYYYISAALVIAFAALMAFRESRRRFFVALKRKPQNIPLIMVTCCFIWYSFNLSLISFTTTKVQADTGFMGFVIMLLSILAVVCCMRAFPYRKKTAISMLILVFVLMSVILLCDILYLTTVAGKMNDGTITLKTLSADDYANVEKTWSVMIAHSVMLGIAAVLVAILPVYRKWIRKINTSIEVEETAEMEAIDISGE